MPKLSKKDRNAIFKAIALMGHMSISLIVCVALGIFIGRLLDNWLGTTPWLLLLFVFLGIGSSFKLIYDLAKRVYE